MWFATGVTTQIIFLVCIISIGLLAATLGAFYVSPSRPVEMLPWGIGARIAEPLEKLQTSFHLVRRNQRVVVSAMALSFLYHSLTVFNTALAGAAVGWTDPSILKLFVVVPIILLIGALPVSPQGLGIQEGAFYYFLQVAGATPAQALGVALVLRAKSYVLALFGGVVWLFQKNQQKEQVSESSL